MSKSPSNNALLVTELRQLVLRYRDKPSPLLTSLKYWMDNQGIGLGQHRRRIEAAKQQRDLLTELIEDGTNFPGWDAL